MFQKLIVRLTTFTLLGSGLSHEVQPHRRHHHFAVQEFLAYKFELGVSMRMQKGPLNWSGNAVRHIALVFEVMDKYLKSKACCYWRYALVCIGWRQQLKSLECQAWPWTSLAFPLHVLSCTCLQPLCIQPLHEQPPR